MAETERAQIYLLTPPDLDLEVFPGQLARVLDAHDIACLRLTLATQDEDRLSRAADQLREIAHARDVALVIDNHVGLVERLGLDGVHLTDGARSVRAARKALGPDAIVGAYCGASRHDGMSAGEAGADYVAFGPVGDTALGDGSRAEADLFAWWSEMIEVPVVAEGALDRDTALGLGETTDFYAVGEEIWSAEDPAAALGALLDGLV
ncbi:MAG: thiamine phosphate synthase [Silicimonas sp.]|nr:thiamine phosphate synthase [Silicimonas sp.]